MVDQHLKKIDFNIEFEDSIKRLLSKPFAKKLDEDDSLKRFRNEFCIPKMSPHTQETKESIYLCGNSLGCMPKRAKKYVEEEILKWSLSGVEGHFCGDRPWAPIDERCSELLMPLVGAKKS